jgi:transcriptional regulator NrdR family protein
MQEQEQRQAKQPRNGPKVDCMACGYEVSSVVPTRSVTYGPGRDAGGSFYRRLRKCEGCGATFSAVERGERLVSRGKTKAA